MHATSFSDFLPLRGGMTAYQAVAYEYAIEMTYPLPEGTAAGLLNFVAMVSSTACLYLMKDRIMALVNTTVLVSFPGHYTKV